MGSLLSGCFLASGKKKVLRMRIANGQIDQNHYLCNLEVLNTPQHSVVLTLLLSGDFSKLHQLMIRVKTKMLLSGTIVRR